MNPKIKINTAPYDEIRQLPFINDAVTQNIIDERTLNGPFNSPGDLARRVKGVGKILARTWSPNIDWDSPVPPEPPKARRWWRVALWITLIVLLPIIVIYPSHESLYQMLVEYRQFMSAAAHRTLTLGAFGCFVILLCVEAVFVTQIIGDLSRSKQTERRCSTYAYKIIIAGALFSLAFSATMALLFSRQSLPGYPSLTKLVIGVLMVPLFLLLLYGMPLYVRNHPALVGSRLLGGVYGVMMLLGPTVMFVVWYLALGSIRMPLTFYLLQVALGITIIVRLYQMLRDRSWYFAQTAGSLAPSVDHEAIRQGKELLEWLNVERPNDSEQRALAGALAGKYLAVRRRAFAGVTLAAGVVSWVVSKGVEAIYESVVQDWAEPYLQALKMWW